jgi:HAE1 family hydrophobic/amphiphilic exporter-1
VQARHGSLPLSEWLSGVVQAVHQIDIYPQVDAVVSEVLVNDGDSVRRGQPLVRLEDREFRQRLKQAEASHRMVMAAQFERFLDPLIVMLAVPLAAVGVVPTLLLTDTSLNVQSLMGIVMLIGIVVNNAIVLVDYINLKRREEGMDVTSAVIESGRLRLRPILMTACTTVLGMLPLAIGAGAGGEIQASMARAVIGGLTVSTLITLVVIPAAYTGVHDVLRRGRG